MAKEKRLALTDFRVDEFNHGVEGVDPITYAGVEVPKSKQDDVKKAAEASGVELREVE